MDSPARPFDPARGELRHESGGRGVVAAALFVLAALAAPGCRSDDGDADPMNQGRVVLGGGEGALAPKPDAREARALAERSLAAAEAAWQAGDPLSAMALCNSALLRGVPGDLEAKFRELRVRARAAVVTDRIVSIRAVPVKDVVSDGDAVPVRLLLRNLSPGEFRAPRSEKGSSDSLFVLDVVREDRDVWGNVRTSEFTLRAPLERDVVVPPGGEGEVHVTIGPDLVKLEHEGFSVFRIGGTFRPVVARVGESEFFDALPVEPAVVRVLRRGWEPLAADPMASLRSAVAKRSPPHVVAAAELLAPADRAEARTFLRDAAERDPPLAFCLDAARVRLDELDGRAAAAGGVRP